MAAIPVVVGVAAVGVAARYLRSWYMADDTASAAPAPALAPSAAAPRKKATRKTKAAEPTRMQAFEVLVLTETDETIPATIVVDADGITLFVDDEVTNFPITMVDSWCVTDGGFYFDVYPEGVDPTDETTSETMRLMTRTPDGQKIAAACRRVAEAALAQQIRKDAAANAAKARSRAAATLQSPAVSRTRRSPPKQQPTPPPSAPEVDDAAVAPPPTDEMPRFASPSSAAVEVDRGAALIALATSKRAELEARNSVPGAFASTPLAAFGSMPPPPPVETFGSMPPNMRQPPTLLTPQSTNESLCQPPMLSSPESTNDSLAVFQPPALTSQQATNESLIMSTMASAPEQSPSAPAPAARGVVAA